MKAKSSKSYQEVILCARAPGHTVSVSTAFIFGLMLYIPITCHGVIQGRGGEGKGDIPPLNLHSGTSCMTECP